MRKDGTLDFGGIKLLEAVEGAGLHRLADRGNRAQRDQLPLRPADVVIQQLLRVQPLAALDLGDDPVATAIVNEAVDVAAA